MSERQGPEAGSPDSAIGSEPIQESDEPKDKFSVPPAIPEPQRIQFSGRGSEYFGIWIVNVLLSIVTLGVWTAWAKVRRVRYFQGHTRILGDPLEYHATGWMIFKGRFLAILVLVAFSISTNFLAFVHPAAPVIPGLALLAIYPWAINMSLRFSARMTSWRNVHFRWRGTYWGVFKVFFLWPLAGALSLGTCYPLAARAIRHYLANNYQFGTTNFSADSRVKPYYAAFGWSLLFLIAVSITAAVVVGVAAGVMSAISPTGVGAGASQASVFLSSFVSVIMFLLSGLVFTILTRNIIINSLRLGDAATFQSDLKPSRFIWIVFTNMIVSVLTLFLMLPWAQVRAFRYQVEGITVESKVPVSSFVDRQEKQAAAFGEEFAELEGLDLAI